MTEETQGLKDPKELREAYDALKEENASLRNEYREFRAETVAREVGMNAQQAKLWLGNDTELTAESARQFATDFGLTLEGQVSEAPPAAEATGKPVEQNPEAPPGQVAEDAALATMGGTTPNVVTPGTPMASEKMSVSEFEGLLKSNPAAAMDAYVNNRVQHAPDNQQAALLRQRGQIA